MTLWPAAVEVLAARPARLPYVLVPFPVVVSLGSGVVLHLMIPIGCN